MKIKKGIWQESSPEINEKLKAALRRGLKVTTYGINAAKSCE